MFRCPRSGCSSSRANARRRRGPDPDGRQSADVWCSDRYAAQQGTQMHVRPAWHISPATSAYTDEASEDMLPSTAQALAPKGLRVEIFGASTIAGKRRALERNLDDILATTTRAIWPATSKTGSGELAINCWPLPSGQEWSTRRTTHANAPADQPSFNGRSPTAIAPCGPPRASRHSNRRRHSSSRAGHEPLQNHPSNRQRLKSAMTEPATLIFRASLRAGLYQTSRCRVASTGIWRRDGPHPWLLFKADGNIARQSGREALSL